MKLFWIPLLFAAPLHAREVAITIDDLPVAQSGAAACEYERLTDLTRRLLEPIRAGHVPVTAFVIGTNCTALTFEQRRAVLRQWQQAGAELGNHTWSHRNLDTMTLADYEADILRGDRELKRVLGVRRIRYFRWPMLHAGEDTATKEGLERFLREQGYREAPVTFDNSDWMFAYVYAAALRAGDTALAERARLAYIPYMESVVEFFERRGAAVVGREFPQILLMHANALNARMLPDLLAMFRKRGYRFVSLAKALRDPAYRLPNRYASGNGISWIHRWSMTKGMPNQGEPDEPEWLRQAYARLSRP
jgi:peptidoglycan-N-acetylglucosamine deacetylase